MSYLDAQSLARRLVTAISTAVDAEKRRRGAGSETSHYGHQHLSDECSATCDDLADVLLDLKQWVIEP